MVILQKNSVREIHSEKWGEGVSGNIQTLAEGHQKGQWGGGDLILK